MKSPALFAVASDSPAQTQAPAAPPETPVPAPPPERLAPTSPADDEKFGQLRRERQKAPMEKGGWNVRVDVQMVAMAQARALQLLPGLQSEDTV